jgi:hypothetical protein
LGRPEDRIIEYDPHIEEEFMPEDERSISGDRIVPSPTESASLSNSDSTSNGSAQSSLDLDDFEDWLLDCLEISALCPILRDLTVIVTRSVLARVLQDIYLFPSHTIAADGKAPDTSGSQSALNSRTPATTPAAEYINNGKRRIKENDSDQDGNDKHDENKRRKLNYWEAKLPKESDLLYACPFFKNLPELHRKRPSCSKGRFDTLFRLK